MLNLDRFAQDLGFYEKHVEPYINHCEWCGKAIAEGRTCKECAEAERICNMPFGQLLEYIQAQVDCYEQTMTCDGVYLQFHWLFDTELEAKKVAKILRAREAKYWLGKKSVMFWVGCGRNGMNFREDSNNL